MKYGMTESEEKLAEIIWEHEPIGSGELVRICQEKLNWKKSTTYTMLKKLTDKELFKNQETMVISLYTKEEYTTKQSIQFVEETFSGSLPKFFAAFVSGKKITRKQADELKRLIDNHEEDQ